MYLLVGWKDTNETREEDSDLFFFSFILQLRILVFIKTFNFFFPRYIESSVILQFCRKKFSWIILNPINDRSGWLIPNGRNDCTIPSLSNFPRNNTRLVRGL